jgi:hypothetical protein
MLESNHHIEGASRKLSRQHMDYKNPHIEVKHMKGKGNGMVTTKNFAASELIMVQKAIVFAQFDPMASLNSLSADSKYASTGAKAKMLPYLVEKLILYPDCGSELYSLAAGSKYPDSVAPGNFSKVDILRMSAILTSNWFSADNNSISKIVDKQRQKSTKGVDSDISKAGTGLWLGTFSLYHHYIIYLLKNHHFFYST